MKHIAQLATHPTCMMVEDIIGLSSILIILYVGLHLPIL